MYKRQSNDIRSIRFKIDIHVSWLKNTCKLRKKGYSTFLSPERLMNTTYFILKYHTYKPIDFSIFPYYTIHNIVYKIIYNVEDINVKRK